MSAGFPGNIQELLQSAQKIQSEFARVQQELEQREVQASAGGGMVTVTANGGMQICAVQIDRSVVNPDDVEMLQDLVRAASNEALRKAKALLKDEMSKLTGGLPIPGFGA